MDVVSDWATTLALIFGGCCSNALTLEQLTASYPRSGHLLTFCQFLAVSLHGLPKFVVFTPYPRLRPRQIPILPYLIQVALFYLISLLNNAAFGYHIPMSVHIIFRSGGLVINMLMGWLILGRRYTYQQTMSVLLVTLGVVLTTLSASGSKDRPIVKSESLLAAVEHTSLYAKGIAILTLALVLSGLLGLVQERTNAMLKTRVGAKPSSAKNQPAAWEESMFYLHFLSMPMFLTVRRDLAVQMRGFLVGPKAELALPPSLSTLSFVNSTSFVKTAGTRGPVLLVPWTLIILALNTFTQLFCIAGVNRLTSRVSSLTVTLILVVRKAVSLIISVTLFSTAGRTPMDARGQLMLWSGAVLVFAGTIGYSLGGSRTVKPSAKKD